MSKIKRINIKEFRDKGFLQEANRLFFHPLGLALEVNISNRLSGFLYYSKLAFGCLVNNGMIALGGIWDYRDDPEGMLYGDLGAPDCIRKKKHVESLRLSKVLDRVKTKCCDKNGVQVCLEK